MRPDGLPLMAMSKKTLGLTISTGGTEQRRSGEAEAGCGAEKEPAADLVYITGRWAVKLSQSAVPEHLTGSPINQSEGV